MRKLSMLCVCVAVAAIMGSSQVMAGEKASTSELPAALQAIGVDQSKILSQAEAQQVRGQHRFRGIRIGSFRVNINININIITVTQNNIAIASPGAFQSNTSFIRIRN